MTDKYEALFAEAFKNMEAKGYFTEMRAKIKAERQAKSPARITRTTTVRGRPVVLKGSKKSRPKLPTSSSRRIATKKAILDAGKKIIERGPEE
jgi:hypothetical protein